MYGLIYILVKKYKFDFVLEVNIVMCLRGKREE